ncbi:hypothetical protein ACQP2K_44210 [Microbispora siamensis]
MHRLLVPVTAGALLLVCLVTLEPPTEVQGTLLPKWVRDHGRLKTQLRWFEEGFRTGRPGACDTWSVPVRQVT